MLRNLTRYKDSSRTTRNERRKGRGQSIKMQGEREIREKGGGGVEEGTWGSLDHT
jgi:hypothetical protein